MRRGEPAGVRGFFAALTMGPKPRNATRGTMSTIDACTPEAFDAYCDALASLSRMTERLRDAIESAAEPSERIHWGHVGTLRNGLAELEDVVRSVEACA